MMTESYFNPMNIPKELQDVPQWVCWDSKKVPLNPKDGTYAKVTSADTWGTFDEAVFCKENNDNAMGIGFVFTQSDNYFGVDLDGCMDNQDFIDEIVDTLGSYTEVSQSGQGIHVICKGELCGDKRRNSEYGIEMYSGGRYFIMTGNTYGDKTDEIEDCTESIKPLYNKYLEREDSQASDVGKERQTTAEIPDDELIRRAIASKTGAQFEVLYQGNWHGAYPSQSEADMAFANMLAFWTGCNQSQMDSIFRSSGLMRPKYDSKRGNTTYGEQTIQVAINDCADVYNPEIGNEDAIMFSKADWSKFGVSKQDEIAYDFSDTGNAKRFVDKYGNKVRYSYQDNGWHYWTGKVWKEDLTGEVKKLADDVIIEMIQDALLSGNKDLLKWAYKTRSSATKRNMIEESKHLEGIPILSNHFDAHKDLLNCQNGIINLKNGELVNHSSDYLMSKISLAEYNKDAKCDRWMQFLYEVCDNDLELIEFLQKAVGYSISGSTKEQCVFFLYGVGNNGKSTFLEIISDIIGSYACNVQPETVMVKSSFASGGANPDIARLRGSRFVTTVEPNEGIRLNEGLLKQLTGGDKVTARFLYGREFEFIPEFKLWMATNHKPIIRGTDLGIWRRIRLIPFTANIPERKIDKALKYKLRRELSGILLWALEGCQKWLRDGLGMPKSVEDATNEYRSEMDILSNFCAECIEMDYTAQSLASDVYNTYAHWADANNEYKMSSTRFGKEFTKRYPEKLRTGKGIFYKNCKITDGGKKYIHGGGVQYDWSGLK